MHVHSLFAFGTDRTVEWFVTHKVPQERRRSMRFLLVMRFVLEHIRPTRI